MQVAGFVLFGRYSCDVTSRTDYEARLTAVRTDTTTISAAAATASEERGGEVG